MFGSSAVQTPSTDKTYSPDIFANLTGRRARTSLSPCDLRLQQALSKRETAAEWITSMLGISIPFQTEDSFRKSLSDGVVLCKLINCIQPGTLPKILEHPTPTDPSALSTWKEEDRNELLKSNPSSSSNTKEPGEVIQAFENVSNFVEAAEKLTGEKIICAADVLYHEQHASPMVHGGVKRLSLVGEEGAEVGARGNSAAQPLVECLLSLRDCWWDREKIGKGEPSSSLCGPPPSGERREEALHVQKQGALTPLAEEIVARGHYHAKNVDILMKSAQFALKTRMGVAATPPLPAPRGSVPSPSSNSEAGDAAPVPKNTPSPETLMLQKQRRTSTTPSIDAVGPVLENVLANLTNEYEKRLLAKDQEHKTALDEQHRLKRQTVKLEATVNDLQRQMESYVEKNRIEHCCVGSGGSEKERELRATLAQAEATASEAVESRDKAERAAAEALAEVQRLQTALRSFEDVEQKIERLKNENRSLYNTVQDLKGSIRVFARVRPRGATGDASSVAVQALEEDSMLSVFSARHNKHLEFNFDRVFGEASSQEDVYKETAPLIRSVLDGYNVCIFAYGQTGSGKTYTMTGDLDTCPGINARALQDLFAQAQQRNDESAYSISIQLLEIYNEQLRDMLISPSDAQYSKKVTLVGNAPSGANVREARRMHVASAQDVLKMLALGSRNRSVAETKMNDRSSRSHQVLTVVVEGKATRGCLHLVDLAGSERVGRSGAEGQQLVEAQHINKSLSSLGSVMHALAQKREHIPYRDSTLTRLLQDSLGGQAKAMMFVHVAPEASSVSETVSALNFGKTVTEVTLGPAQKHYTCTQARFPSDEKADVMIKRLERQLQEERAKNASLESQVMQNGLSKQPECFKGQASEKQEILQRDQRHPTSSRNDDPSDRDMNEREGLSDASLIRAAHAPYDGAMKTPVVPKLPLAGLFSRDPPMYGSYEGSFIEKNPRKLSPSPCVSSVASTRRSRQQEWSKIPAPTPPQGGSARLGSITSRRAMPRSSCQVPTTRVPQSARGAEDRGNTPDCRARIITPGSHTQRRRWV